jgi:hypothetical protein
MPLPVPATFIRIRASSTAPVLPWSRTILLGLLLAGGSIGGLEACWREQGYRPDVPETAALWGFWRTCIYARDGRVVVFLGTSRVRADIDLAVLKRAYPAYRFVQLGINGDVGQMGMLRSIALDQRFRGVVICELAAPFLDRSRWQDERDDDRQPFSRQTLDPLAYAYLRGQAVVVDPRVSIASVARQLLSTDVLPPPWQCRTCFDRSLRYTGTAARGALDDGHELARQKPVDPRSLEGALAAVRESVEQLKDRRGSVVFVGLPASVPTFGAGRERFTNSGFTNGVTWSRVADLTGAVCIPLESGDSIGPFRCFDGLHLDEEQAKRFTECLIAGLRRNRVLE